MRRWLRSNFHWVPWVALFALLVAGAAVRATYFVDIITKGPWVDVRACGATGDGVTDDTAAIQAAITSGAKRIYAPKGNYVIGNAGLELPSDIEFFGDGESTVFSIAEDAQFTNNGLFYGTNKSNIYLHDFSIVGGSSISGTADTAQKGTYFTATTGNAYSHIDIERVHIKGIKGEGLYCDKGTGNAPTNVNYRYNFMEDSCGPCAMNHNYTGGAESHVIGNRVHSVKSHGYEGPGEDSIIAYNTFKAIGGSAILIHNGTTSEKVRNRVIGNTILGTGGVATDAGIYYQGYGGTIALNEVQGYTGAGIHLVGTVGENETVNVLILGNTVHGNATAAAGTRADIRIETGTDISLIGNFVEREGTTATGILIESAVTRAYVALNTVVGAYTNKILNSDTASVVGLNFTGASSTDLRFISGISGTVTAAGSLRGQETISNTASTAAVSFGAAEADTSYFVVCSVSTYTGTPAAGSTNAYAADKTVNGFNLNVEAAPGAGNSVIVDWILIR